MDQRAWPAGRVVSNALLAFVCTAPRPRMLLCRVACVMSGDAQRLLGVLLIWRCAAEAIPVRLRVGDLLLLRRHLQPRRSVLATGRTIGDQERLAFASSAAMPP